jgi:replicative DNA helicase
VTDPERIILWKAITEGSFLELPAQGFIEDHFADEECREVYAYLSWFQNRHNATPSAVIVKREFPDFEPALSTDPLSFHIEEFVALVKKRTAIEQVRGFADSIEDPDEVMDIELRAFEMARSLAELLPSPRAVRFSDGNRRKAEYDERKKTGVIRGIYLGIPTIDKNLMGLRPGQLATIVAYMGVGKSILIAYIAFSAYLQGKTSLIISLEMDADEIMERIDVMATQIRYQALRALELDTADRKRWEQVLDRAESERHERDILIRDDIPNCTVERVNAEMARYNPDVTFVDYLELMSVPRASGLATAHWEKVNNAGTGLKQVARLLRKPIVTAAQLNREGGRDRVNLANVAHQSIGKHSDIMLALSQDEEMEAINEMEVVSLKVRAGAKPRTTLRWNLDRMDIGEKGIEDRFPVRIPLSNTMRARDYRHTQKLEIARLVAGRENPWSARIRKERDVVTK